MLTDTCFSNTTNLMETVYFLGIDISKKTLDVALTTDAKQFVEARLDNNVASINVFIRDLKKQLKLKQLIVCAEHTGIYSYPLLSVLAEKKVRVCIEPALQIKQSQGMTRGKSDPVDARRIASYALKNQHNLRFWAPERESIQKLKALLATRERLIKIRKQLEVPIDESQNFIEKKILKSIGAHCQSSLDSVRRDIKKIEITISELVKADDRISQQLRYATSVTGIGKIVGLNVIIATGEFERIADPKKFACYSGVAPFEHCSGSSVRGRTRVSKMANMTIKTLLHLAAMSAINTKGELQDYYNRRLVEGKNKMAVINAVRNKLITRVYACVRQQKLYQKFHHNVLA